MAHQRSALSQRYVAALRAHLKRGPRASLRSAREFGRHAVTFGLETLDLARIHERALGTLDVRKNRNGHLELAEQFFTEAIIPIIETRRAARQGKIDLDRLNESLTRRTAELAATNLQLQRGVVRRKSVEAALQKSEEHSTRLLKDSLRLQDDLRRLTHQVLAAQEEARKKISHELQDELAQTLLGINVRLLSLRQGARSNSKGLQDEIATTRRLVVESAQSARRVAREVGKA